MTDHRAALAACRVALARPLGCCQCGCGRQTNVATRTSARDGSIKGTPLRYIKGHSGGYAPRLEGDYLIDAATGCWVWQKHRSSRGYGSLNRDGHSIAHRWYYERLIGPIPQGLQLDHLCRNRACVNPAHLEPVTNAENGQRGDAARLSWEAIQEIRESTQPTGAIAARYGVSISQAGRIRSRKTWALPGQEIDRRRWKLRDDDVRRIRALWAAGGVSQSAIAREYGVSSVHVSAIVRGLARRV